MTDRHTEPDKIWGQVRACHHRRYTPLIVTNVLKMDCNYYRMNKFQITRVGTVKHGEGNSVFFGFKTCACVQQHGTRPVPTGALQKVVLPSLLALLLRLVLARTDPLKFSVNLDGIKICGPGREIKRFPAKRGGGKAGERKKKPGGGQTASRGGEGRYISAQDKSAFHGEEGRGQEQPQRGEHVAPCHLPLSSFSDLKINKRQVQRHGGKKKKKNDSATQQN